MDNGKIQQIGNLFPDTEGFENRTAGRVYNPNGLCPTIRTPSGGGITPMIMETDKTICLNSKVNGKQPSLQDRVYDVAGCSTAITTSFLPSIAEPARIRKLTPRECFRLMSVSEENIDKIQAAGISNSQQYKLAGNSIDVNVLKAIFRQLFKFNQTQQTY